MNFAAMMRPLATDTVVCDTIAPFTGFDATKFVGTWYEQMHVSDPQEPTSYQCETAQYYNLDSGAGTFKVYNSFQSPVFGFMTPRLGVHADASCDSNAACYVVFFGKTHEEPNLHIVDTDYDTYAINYNCDTELNRVYVWLNTRDPTPSDELVSWMYERSLELFPSFDYTTYDPRITQGSKCSYGDLPTTF
jgi:lipocalin